MEKLLVHTIYIRTKTRLTELKKEMKSQMKGVQCMFQKISLKTTYVISFPIYSVFELFLFVDRFLARYSGRAVSVDSNAMLECRTVTCNR